MTIYAIYQAEDGRLVSATSSAAALAAPAVLAARGYAVAERPDNEAGGLWNAATLAFDPRPDDAAPRVLTPLQFRDLFTFDEEVAITAAAQASIPIRVWLDRLAAATEVDLDDPRTAAGVQSLEGAGLIGAGRAAEVLA